ncbi:MAG: hypothetical protein FWE54_05040 [Methanimicrococcus sp.]|nr:hypothetical protein [Methanimicrococcus sp.]
MTELQDYYNEYFLKVCSDIGETLVPHGFQVSAKGQRLKKTSKDKDLVFEIYFRRNYLTSYMIEAGVSITPEFYITSKKLKQWLTDQIESKNIIGSIYCNELGECTPYMAVESPGIGMYDDSKRYEIMPGFSNKRRCSWLLDDGSLKGSNENTAKLIAERIEHYLLPIFDIFEGKEKSIDFLLTSGTRFNPWLRSTISPLPYIVQNGGPDKASQFLKDFIEDYFKRDEYHANSLRDFCDFLNKPAKEKEKEERYDYQCWHKEQQQYFTYYFNDKPGSYDGHEAREAAVALAYNHGVKI